jgi:hypothetical protein
MALPSCVSKTLYGFGGGLLDLLIRPACVLTRAWAERADETADGAGDA